MAYKELVLALEKGKCETAWIEITAKARGVCDSTKRNTLEGRN